MLCSIGTRTCGACCWSDAVPRAELAARLRRHLRLFSRHLSKEGRLAPWSLLWHELRARQADDIVWGLLLRLPIVGRRLQSRLAKRTVCAFAAFRDEDERQVGCLLHPTRWGGVDRRPSAFRLLPGFGCGAASYACDGAAAFTAAPELARRRFEEHTRALDWFAYSQEAPGFGSARSIGLWSSTDERSAPCPSSSTKPSR